MKKRERGRRTGREPERPAVGLEAELACVVDGEPVDPKDVFADPRTFIGTDAMHRLGSSYHLPNGGAIYFDTGVMELVTPVIEIDHGAPARAVRSLWEGICAVREGLDRWSAREGRSVRLVGFSTHYNVSLPELGEASRIRALARLLVHVLAAPVILLATNRRSSGVGVRPRPRRIEVTADFTPDPALMTATAAVVIAAVREAARWTDLDPGRLPGRGIPVPARFAPVPHTSREGWLIRADGLAHDPFRTPPDAPVWDVAGGGTRSLRALAAETVAALEPGIRSVARAETLDLIRRVTHRRHPSLLDLDDRPPSYEDVGRLCLWREADGGRPLPRSLYERVMLDAARRRPLEDGARRWLPVGTRGWTHVLYERDDGRRRVFSVDELVRLRVRRARRASPGG